MIRQVDLVSYLPMYLRKFLEIPATLEAEDPEFVLAWNAANQVLENEFIATADEYGISRFESILGILVSKEDTLESRRARVQARWFSSIPYTIRTFVAKLETLCGDTDFELIKDFEEHYLLTLYTNLELFGQVEELENIINTMVPCNIVVDCKNSILCGVTGDLLFGGGLVYSDEFMITNDFNETNEISGGKFGGGIVNTATVFITNDFKEDFSIGGNGDIASGVVFSEIVGVANS